MTRLPSREHNWGVDVGAEIIPNPHPEVIGWGPDVGRAVTGYANQNDDVSDDLFARFNPGVERPRGKLIAKRVRLDV